MSHTYRFCIHCTHLLHREVSRAKGAPAFVESRPRVFRMHSLIVCSSDRTAGNTDDKEEDDDKERRETHVESLLVYL